MQEARQNANRDSLFLSVRGKIRKNPFFSGKGYDRKPLYLVRLNQSHPAERLSALSGALSAVGFVNGN